MTSDVSKSEKSISVILLHCKNMYEQLFILLFHISSIKLSV